MQITEDIAANMAKQLAKSYKELQDFFKEPANARAYREWYIEKYGCEPIDEVRL